MDTSKIQDEIAVTKSTDIPTHEQRRLKERAGTVWNDAGYLPWDLPRPKEDWKPKNKKRTKHKEELYKKKSVMASSIVSGKDPNTGRPSKRAWGGLGSESKTEDEEREY